VVELVEVPQPVPGPGELLVRVEAAALCPTDRRLAERGSPEPRIPGHEIGGRLEDGTAVGVHPDVGCGTCAFCRAGDENRCPNRTSIGLDRDGGLADWLSVPAPHALPLGDLNLGLAPLLEPLACCLHAVAMLAVLPGERAVVVGAGAMGILSTWALQEAGAVVAVCQRSPTRRRLALKLGANAVCGPAERPLDVLGEPPRVAVVTAPGAEPIEWAMREVAVGGAVHVFAGTPGGAPVDANLVHYRHLTLVGSTGSVIGDYERALALVASGRIPLSRLPTSTIPLEEVPSALLDSRDPRELKVLVDLGSPG
jgi:threonine dehydrogenase-like Zn-dependent dehydrogenase